MKEQRSAEYQVRLKDINGNIIYPFTISDAVIFNDGTNLTSAINNLEQRTTVLNSIK